MHLGSILGLGCRHWHRSTSLGTSTSIGTGLSSGGTRIDSDRGNGFGFGILLDGSDGGVMMVV